MANDGIVINIDGDASALESSVNSAISGIQNSASKAGMGLANVKAGVDMVTAAVKTLAGVAQKGVNYNATMESYRTSFEVMTGSAEKAAEVVERLRTMGAETPFETTDLVQTTQLLMQYGFTADDAIEKMSMLGDIAQGDANKMTSIATGYAQMSSAGKVNLQDIKQMINGGFNPLQEISERTGESMASLYDRISKGTMSVDEITQAMVTATSEGGKFYQSMEKQSQTMSGQLATLQDNANELLGSITSGLSSEMQTNLLPMVNNMIAELQSAFDAGGINSLIDEATSMIPDLIGMMTGKLDDALNGLTKWAPKLAEALTSALPSVVNGLSSAVPAITTALFQVASNVMSGLIAMLPELVPALADGLVNMVGSALNGLGTLMDGVVQGVEKAFHQGEEQIAGAWVNSENVNKIKEGLSVDIDTSEANEKIQSAYSQIYNALNKSPLTESQKAEIIALIGSDYQTIYDKLIEFGLTPEAAAELATNVTEAGDTIIQAYEGLDVGLDATTLARLTAQSNGSRIVMKGLLKDMGLSDSDIQEVMDVYDECLGKVKDGTPSIIEEIYDKLTDGEPDDEETTKTLKDNIAQYVDGLLSDLETEYNTRLGELDVNDKEYATKKAELDEWYNGMKSEITEINSGMVGLVDTYGGSATELVEGHMEEFAALEERLYGVENEIDRVSAKTSSSGENAYEVVRSGAQTDQATIGLAINYKATEYKVDEQAAEDTYNAALEELNQKLAKGQNGEEGGITVEEYNTQKAQLDAEKEAAIQAAKQQYEQALSEMFEGIAESEGNSEALAAAAEKLDLSEVLRQAAANLEGQDGLIGDSLGEELTQQLADHLEIDPEILKNMPTDSVQSALTQWADELTIDAGDESMQLLSGKVGEAYKGALDEGFLEGTSFDTSNAEEQFSAILAGITAGADTSQMQANLDTATSGLTVDMSSAVDSAEDGAGDVVDAMDVTSDAKTSGTNTGKGYYNGLNTELARAESMAIRRTNAIINAMNKTAEIGSPSKRTRRTGEFIGQGMKLGLQSSMAEAVQTAKYMSGKILTATDLSQTTRVNMPSLTQEIKLANEQSSTPVNLDGKQIATIQGHNNSMTIAWNNTRYAKGVGSK